MFGEVSRDGHPWFRTPQRIPLEEFHRITPLVVSSVVELVITGPEESIFFLRREGGEGGKQFDGLWHLPGGYQMGAESRIQALERLAQKELQRPILRAKLLDQEHLIIQMEIAGGRCCKVFIGLMV